MSLNPFFETYVQVAPKDNSVVYWGLRRQFNEAGPYIFRVQWAETANVPNDDWSNVGEPVTDTYWVVDETQRIFAKEHESYYRVVLTTGESNTYTSDPFQARGNLDKRAWRIFRDLCRKERLNMVKYGGVKGKLYKRKIWGEKCVCVDPMTDDVANSQCTKCYGTGITGGYWVGYETYYLDQAGKGRKKEINQSTGMVENITMQVRFLAYPHVCTNDLFIEDGSSDIWSMRAVDDTVKIQEVPAVYTSVMALLPRTHVAYRIGEAPPVPPTPPTPPPPVPPYQPPTEDPIVPETDGPAEALCARVGDNLSIMWEGNNWTIKSYPAGDDEVVLYSTDSDDYDYRGIPGYTWLPALADRAQPTITATDDGFTLSGGFCSKAEGYYARMGYYNGARLYILDVEA